MERYVRVCKNKSKAFGDNQSGSATTEWVVAVAIVVLMAVPVLAIVGGGSERGSQDLVISIQETDNFGGEGLPAVEGAKIAAVRAAGDARPGENMGVGFPVGPDGVTLPGSSADGVATLYSRPRFYLESGDGSDRRDKVIANTLDRPADETSILVSGVSDSLPNTPNIPSFPTRNLALAGADCGPVDHAMPTDVLAYMSPTPAITDPQPKVMVIAASGR